MQHTLPEMSRPAATMVITVVVNDDNDSVVVVSLASRPPQFLGSASSAPEGWGTEYGANLVRD